jgi:hypothetical protein
VQVANGMIYLKSIFAGLLAVFLAAVLTIIVATVYLSIASRSSQIGAVGWDPISIAKPLPWIWVVLGIFGAGFFWESFRVRSQ